MNQRRRMRHNPQTQASQNPVCRYTKSVCDASGAAEIAGVAPRMKVLAYAGGMEGSIEKQSRASARNVK